MYGSKVILFSPKLTPLIINYCLVVRKLIFSLMHFPIVPVAQIIFKEENYLVPVTPEQLVRKHIGIQ